MMKNTLSWALLLGAGFLLFNACEEVNPDYPQEADRAEFMHQSMKKLTDVIVHDIFSPPVASRIYVYPSVAA
ncbi:MAG: phosphatidic acid phosphatase, partial [Bacteroidota bacterium]